MKNYSEVQATSLLVYVELELIGQPEYSIVIDGIRKSSVSAVHWVNLSQPFDITIELIQGSVRILSLTVDGLELIPKYDYLAEYLGSPTSYLDKPGQWRLSFDRPFYQWLHQTTGQGWLLEPVA